MERQKLLKVASITVILIVASFGTLTTWGLMTQILGSQTEIIEQQNHLIDLQEKIIANINTIFTEKEGENLPLNVEAHLEMWHYDNQGVLQAYSRRAGVLTDTGKEWIEDQLGDAAVAEGDYIGMSNNTGAPSSGWSILPDETTTGAMGRTQGTYADDGTGQWNITHSFSPSESNSTQLVGLYYSAHPASSLIASDTITLINYQSGDTVQLRWTVTAS